MIKATLGRDLLFKESIINLKGISLRDFKIVANNSTGASNELVLSIIGRAPKQGEDGEEDADLTLKGEIFSRFKSFNGAKNIEYSLIRKTHTDNSDSDLATSDQISPADLLLKETFVPKKILLGFEIFSPRFLSLFGFSPVALTKVLVALIDNSIFIEIHREGSTKKLPKELPFDDINRLSQLKKWFEDRGIPNFQEGHLEQSIK